MRFLRYKALKSVMGPGRVGPRILRFSLKYERTLSARCARSLLSTRIMLIHWFSLRLTSIFCWFSSSSPISRKFRLWSDLWCLQCPLHQIFYLLRKVRIQGYRMVFAFFQSDHKFRRYEGTFAPPHQDVLPARPHRGEVRKNITFLPILTHFSAVVVKTTPPIVDCKVARQLCQRNPGLSVHHSNHPETMRPRARWVVLLCSRSLSSYRSSAILLLMPDNPPSTPLLQTFVRPESPPTPLFDFILIRALGSAYSISSPL